jgi:hypothetical protein
VRVLIFVCIEAECKTISFLQQPIILRSGLTMSLIGLLGIIFLAGAVGGITNALLTDNGFIMPKSETANGSQIYRPGIVGNIIISGVAACISWGLYGPFANAYILGAIKPVEEPFNGYGITLSAIVGAVLIGVAGARWLTNEVDKTLLRAAASEAATAQPSEKLSRKIHSASPASALKIAQGG